MKNKRILIGIIVMVCMIFIPKNVSAVPLCLKSTKAKYETLARKASFSYKLAEDRYGQAYYKLVVNNLDKNLIIKDGDFSYVSPDGISQIEIDNVYRPESEYTFYIYTSRDLEECGDSLVLSKKIKFPYYNIYSERDECVEYEEFPLCGVNYKGKIESNEDFDNQLREWLEKSKTKLEEYKDERNIIERFVDLYKDNIEISVGITIILGFLVIALLVRAVIRRSKRAKVKVK